MKKIISLVLVLVLALTAIGGTLAYFTDTDAQVNTFTTGNVAIDLFEDFGDNDGIEHLMPAVGSAQDGTLENGIEKEVYVSNTGSEPAYVRVHIAIPQLLDDGAENFNASNNILHFNYAKDSIGADKWDWSKSADDDKFEGNWNYYTTEIDDIDYNVYVVTYGSPLVQNQTTVDAMKQVYMDKDVTNEDITELKEALGNNWHIYVVAEGGQSAGFENAYDALNTQFGTPGAEGYEAPSFKAENENTTFLEWLNVQGK